MNNFSISSLLFFLISVSSTSCSNFGVTDNRSQRAEVKKDGFNVFSNRSIIIEAENHSQIVNASISAVHSGASGNEFLDFHGQGAYVIWDEDNLSNFNLSRGTYTIEIQYGNGSSRPSVLYINNTRVIEATLSVQGPDEDRGDWSKWKTESYENIVVDEDIKELKLVAENSAGPNLDYIRLIRNDDCNDSSCENLENSPSLPYGVLPSTNTNGLLEGDGDCDNANDCGPGQICVNEGDNSKIEEAEKGIKVDGHDICFSSSSYIKKYLNSDDGEDPDSEPFGPENPNQPKEEMITDTTDRFSAPNSAVYQLNDSRARVPAKRIANTGFSGNGHTSSWDGRLMVSRTNGGWLSRVFRPESVRRNTDGTPNFVGAFSSGNLLEEAEKRIGSFEVETNWIAMSQDLTYGIDNPFRSNSQGEKDNTGSYLTYKALIFHTVDDDNIGKVLGLRKAEFVIEGASTERAEVIKSNFTSGFDPLISSNGKYLRCIEPTVTNDGRLVICQGSEKNNSMSSSDTGNIQIDRLIYSYNKGPDIQSGWTEFKNLSRMYHDDRNEDTNGLKFYERYPIAEFQFKAPSGELIPDGRVMRGAYPWISRDGSELFYLHTRRSNNSRRSGTSVVGRWTGGMLRHIDGPINPWRDKESRLFYSSPGQLTTMWHPFKDLQDPVLPYSIRGAGYSLFHSNKASYSEVSFDDYLDGNYVMYLGMNEQLDMVEGDDNTNRQQYHIPDRTPDTSGNFNNGRLIGGSDKVGFPVEFENNDRIIGKHGQAIHFRQNGYIKIDKNSGWDSIRDEFTIDFFLKLKSNNSGKASLFNISDSVEIYLENNDIKATIGDNSGKTFRLSNDSNFARDIWYHIALVYRKDIETIELYVDAEKKSSTEIPDFGDLNTSGDIYIGPRNAESSVYLRIDEVKVSNVAREQYELNYFAYKSSKSQIENNVEIPEHLSSLRRYATPVSTRSLEVVSLGEKLFNDTILSLNKSTSCATCHIPNDSFTDGLPIAMSNEPNGEGIRNTPTLINRLFSTFQGWGGGPISLEKQAVIPITAVHEMNLPISTAVERLNSDTSYLALFNQSFGEQASASNLSIALAAFQSTIFSPKNEVDKYKNNESNNLSESARRGLRLFEGKARCSGCHAGVNFTDESFRNTGLTGDSDNGRGGKTGRNSDHRLFKVPTLRDISKTAPYMHDGSFDSLEDVIKAYDEGPFHGNMIDTDMRKLFLTEDEKIDLLEFMNAL